MTATWHKWIGKNKLRLTKAQKRRKVDRALFNAYRKNPDGVFKTQWQTKKGVKRLKIYEFEPDEEDILEDVRVVDGVDDED